MDANVAETRLKKSKSHDQVKKLSKFQKLWSDVTLEPMWLGVGTTFMINVTSFKNLYLQRACLVDLGYSEDECRHSEGDLKLALEIESQKVLSSIMVTSGFVSSAITFAMVLFLAPWSDSSGRRKPLIIMSILGTACSSVALLAAVALPQLSASWIVYLHTVPYAIGGHLTILGLAGFNYLGDICYKTGRCTLSIVGTNMAFLTIALTVGAVLGPLAYRWFNFIGLFSLCLILEIFSLIYAMKTIEDINVGKRIPNVLDLRLPWRAVRCFLQERKSHRRRNIILMTIVSCANSSTAVVEISLSYMYLRNRFAWTEVEYGALLTLKNILCAIGTFFIVGVLRKRLQMQEVTIGILGGVSQLSAVIALMLSSSSLMIYCTCFVIILARGVIIADMPVRNKQIVANEQGKISCVNTLLGLLCSFLILPLCNQLYRLTLEWFPGAFLFFSASMSVLQILCYALVRENDIEADEKIAPSECIRDYSNSD